MQPMLACSVRSLIDGMLVTSVCNCFFNKDSSVVAHFETSTVTSCSSSLDSVRGTRMLSIISVVELMPGPSDSTFKLLLLKSGRRDEDARVVGEVQA